jgi:hypothetical protein
MEIICHGTTDVILSNRAMEAVVVKAASMWTSRSDELELLGCRRD